MKDGFTAFNLLPVILLCCAGLLPCTVQAQCDITNVVATASLCDAAGMVTFQIDVYSDTQLNGGQVEVRTRGLVDGSFHFTDNILTTYTGTPTRVSILRPGYGGEFELLLDVASSGLDPTCTNAVELSTNVTVALCPQTPAITNVQVVGFGPCDEFGFVEAVVEVYTQNASGQSLNASIENEWLNTNVTANPMVARMAVRGDGNLGEIEVWVGGNPNKETVFFTPPVCAEQCMISEFSLVSVNVLPSGYFEVVTKVVADASSNTMIYVDYSSNFSSPAAGTNYFTNTVFFMGYPVTMSVQSSDHPALDYTRVCPSVELTLDPSEFCFTNGCPAITDARFTFGPCDEFGFITATVEVSHTNIPAESVFSIRIFDMDSFVDYFAVPLFMPVAESPMTYSFLVPGHRDGVPFADVEQRVELTFSRPPGFSRDLPPDSLPFPSLCTPPRCRWTSRNACRSIRLRPVPWNSSSMFPPASPAAMPR